MHRFALLVGLSATACTQNPFQPDGGRDSGPVIGCQLGFIGDRAAQPELLVTALHPE